MDDREWHLRLFLSGDLIGSTACKSALTSDKDAPGWPSLFRDFYQDLPTYVDGAYVELPEFCCKPSARMRPWKTLGDEMVFEVELRSFKESLTHVCAFRAAIRKFNLEWKSKPVKLKGTAWLAGFPVTNVQVELPSAAAGGSMMHDFIGPSIDTGFRLSRLATDRKLIVSVDLAMMLADAMAACRAHDLRFYYDGKEHFKGVLNERPYPVFWLDLLEGETPLEEQLFGVQKNECALDKVARFTHEFLTQLLGIRPPFIPP